MRTVESKDIPRIWAIQEDAYGPQEIVTPRELKHLLTRPGSGGILIEEFGKIIGFALWWLSDNSETATLTHLAVDPEHQRMGVATQLIKTIKDAVNRPEIVTAVDSRNLPGQRTLRRGGFQCTRCDNKAQIYWYKLKARTHKRVNEQLNR